MHYEHPAEIMDEIARLTPTFAGVSYREARRARLRAVALQRRRRPQGTPIMHVDGFVRGKGRFMITDYVPTDERTRPRVPAAAHHRPHLSASTTSARRPAAPPTRVWHEEDMLEIHPSDAESRGIRERRSRGRWSPAASAQVSLHAPVSPTGCSRASSTPPSTTRSRGQRDHHRLLRLGHQLPRIQGHRCAGAPHATSRPTGRSSTAPMSGS
jgi:hypothetical protein